MIDTNPPELPIQEIPIQETKGSRDPEKQQQDGANTPNEKKTSIYKSLGWLDRFLAVWILLAMAVGIILGEFVNNVGPALQKSTFVGVSVPIGKVDALFPIFLNGLLIAIAVGLLVMMYPIMCKVRFETLHRVFRTREIWKQIAFSIVLNWIIAPLLMVSTDGYSLSV
jgi:ACR3 family arsenite transporter